MIMMVMDHDNVWCWWMMDLDEWWWWWIRDGIWTNGTFLYPPGTIWGRMRHLLIDGNKWEVISITHCSYRHVTTHIRVDCFIDLLSILSSSLGYNVIIYLILNSLTIVFKPVICPSQQSVLWVVLQRSLPPHSMGTILWDFFPRKQLSE